MNYILYGEDDSRIRLKLENIRKSLDSGLPVIYYNANEDTFEDCLAEMDSSSLFDPQKIIVIENAAFLSARNTSKYDPEKLAKRLDCDHILIFTLHGSLDKRKKVVKQFQERCKVYNCQPLDAKSQPAFIREQLERAGVRVDTDALHYICSHVGMDVLVIQNEVEKLSIYSDHITLADAKALVSVEPANDIFKMSDALFNKDILRMLAFYRNFRAQNMEPMAIIAILSGQLRFLYQVRVLMDEGMSQQQIASKLKAHPYRVQVNMAKAARFGAGELLEELNLMAELDQNMKMGLLDKDLGFEQFALNLLRKEER
jgi:DNA polymerase-3 subunit delta